MRFLKGSILCLGLFCYNSLSAEQEIKEEQKIYIQPVQIRVEQHGIFVEFPTKSVNVLAIHHDSIGTYIMTTEYKLSRCPRGHYSPDGDGLCEEEGCPYNR